jgi:parallel beta-helix repeat protein
MNPAHILYVSPAGDDRWSGMMADPLPRGDDGPFATLAAARDAIRALRASPVCQPAPITVRIRGGMYYLPETLRLGKDDGGTRDAPVTYESFPGETPILSGGIPVVGWLPWRDGILRAEMPGSRGGKWRSRQLFLEGQRLSRARWPKADPADPLYGGWAYIEGPAHVGSLETFVYRPGTFPHRWAKPTEVEVVYWPECGQWCSMVPIREIDEVRRTIRLQHAGWQFDVPGWYQQVFLRPDNRFRVENGLEDLTEPGEWCFDSEDGVLYLKPPEAGLDGRHVVATVLDSLVDIRGASWITLRGLTFTETTDGDNIHREGVEGAGAMYPRTGWRYCGEAVHLRNANHCLIEDCRFDSVGGNGVYLEGDCARDGIRGNEFAGVGANGVCLMGTRTEHPVFNEVTDNYIHHGGAINKYTAGVFAGRSDGNVISHNRFEHLPHHAVNLSNNPWGRNFVEYNDIRWVDEEISDSAAINCWMEDPPERGTERCGHVIRFNRIADVYGCEVADGRAGRSRSFPTSGIYLDNYTSNCVVYGNIVVRCSHAGIVVHAGKNNLIENNIVVDCLEGVRLQDFVSGMPYWKLMTGYMTGNHVLRNILANTHGSCTAGEPAIYVLFTWTERMLGRCDDNVLWLGSGVAVRLMDLADPASGAPTFAAWRALGFDEHSVVSDPLFADAGADDFRLRPNSPALALGFSPIDASRIGPRRGTGQSRP